MSNLDPSVLFPRLFGGTLGAGSQTYVDPSAGAYEAGDFEKIPNRRTPPYGEPPLNWEPEEHPYPSDPPINVLSEDEFLHEQMHGLPWRGYVIQEWVNPSNPGIPNLGPVNDQPVQSGHTQITVNNSSAEQGWGMDPAILLARYPHSENVNPTYALGTHRRNGQLEYVNDGLPVAAVSANRVQLLTRATRQRSTTHVKLVDNPGMIPYSASMIPTGGAQPLALNVIPDADDGVY